MKVELHDFTHYLITQRVCLYDSIKRFLFTLFPDLKGKDAHWFVKLITDDVVKEIKKQNGEEGRKYVR